MKLAATAALFLLIPVFTAVSAHADPVTDAKVQCQVEFDWKADGGTLCQRGVEIAAREADNARAMTNCRGESEDAQKVKACQRGVALHARYSGGAVHEDQKSSFSYSWQPKRGTAELDVGDYQLRVGDAEKQAEECMRQFEGSATPPSCLSGLSAQRKAPEPLPRSQPPQ